MIYIQNSDLGQNLIFFPLQKNRFEQKTNRFMFF